MKVYAVLNQESIIVNMIVASSLDIAESVTSSTCIFVPTGTEAAIGWAYNNETFINPNPQPEETDLEL
jgi:hypothetical protein